MLLNLTIAGCVIRELPDGRVQWTAGMMIDADGAYRAYHPQKGMGLDALGNAKDANGDWVGIVTVDGDPVVQKASDPAPGYFVSATTLQDFTRLRTDPRRYLDSETVPYIVVPPSIINGVKGVVMGCRALVRHVVSGRMIEAVVGDVGPRKKLGEASMATARELGVPNSPRTGGLTDRVISYTIWPGVPAHVDVLAGIDGPRHKRSFALQSAR